MALLTFPQGSIYSNSIISDKEDIYALGRLETTSEKRLLVQGNINGFRGQKIGNLLVCPLIPQNAAELRSRLKWLNPVPLGRQTSFGFGDRLGSATPGHVAALRAVDRNQRIAPNICPTICARKQPHGKDPARGSR